MAYSIIYADPPWQYRNRGVNGAASKHYATLTMDELLRLDVQGLSAADSTLFLWATWPTLKDALLVMEAWGFAYKTVGFVWLKKTK